MDKSFFRLIKKCYPGLFTLTGLLLPMVTKAIELQVPIAGKTSVESINEYIRIFYLFFVPAAGVLAVVMIAYGGFRWLTAAGSPQAITEAKDTVISAVFGLILALSSYVLLNTINPAITRLDPLIVPNVPGMFADTVISYGVDECSVKNLADEHAEGCSAQWEGGLNNAINQQTAEGPTPATLVKAVMKQESAYCPDAQSNAGACGPMQLLPSTAVMFASACGVTETVTCDYLKSNPTKSLCMGVQYLNELWGQNNGDITRVVAGYNGGQGANAPSSCCPGKTQWECLVDCNGGVITPNVGYNETRNYVNKVGTYHNQICTESGGHIPGSEQPYYYQQDRGM